MLLIFEILTTYDSVANLLEKTVSKNKNSAILGSTRIIDSSLIILDLETAERRQT